MASLIDRLIGRLTEAMGPIPFPIDQDENLYRRLSESPRNLQPVEQARMIEYAAYLYYRNPMARRLIEIQKDYALGDGFQVSSDDATLLEVLNRHWYDPINDWPKKGAQRFTDLRLFGEACWPVTTSEGTGNVMLGVIDPGRIRAVVRDPQQVDEADVVIVNSYAPGGQAQSGGAELVYKVIRQDPASGRLAGVDPRAKDLAVSLPGAATLTIRPGDYVGSCFYFAINKIGTASRGISDLFALIDYLDGLDSHLWTLLERAKLANGMVYDVAIDGSPNDVLEETKRIRDKQPTRPGTVNVHSKNIVWEVLEPKLAAAENDIVLTELRQHIAGGVGLPESYFGKGSDTNRATIEGQADPVQRRMGSIQNDWVSVMNTVLRYQVEQAMGKGLLPKLTTEALDPAKPIDAPGNKKTTSSLDPAKPLPWKLTRPDLATKDVARLGPVISQLVVALAEAEQQQYVSKDTARVGFLTLLKTVGVEGDPEDEKKKIDDEQAKLADDAAALGYHTPPGGTEPVPGKDGNAVLDMQQQQVDDQQAHELKLAKVKKKPLTEADFTTSIIALYPDEYAASRHAVPGGTEPADMHVTLAYLGETEAISDRFSKIANVVRELAASRGPLAGTIAGAGAFDRPNDQTVQYASVSVPGLNELRTDLVRALHEAGVTVDDSLGFTPHMTLAYGDQVARDVISGPVTFSHLTFAYSGQRYDVPFASVDAADAAPATEAAPQPSGPVKLDHDFVVYRGSRATLEVGKRYEVSDFETTTTREALPADARVVEILVPKESMAIFTEGVVKLPGGELEVTAMTGDVVTARYRQHDRYRVAEIKDGKVVLEKQA